MGLLVRQLPFVYRPQMTETINNNKSVFVGKCGAFLPCIRPVCTSHIGIVILVPGGFGPEVTADTLYAVFGTFGDIVSVQLPKDPSERERQQHQVNWFLRVHTADHLLACAPLAGPGAKRRHRGFGFVEFQEVADALDAVDNMHLNEINGKRLRVNLAQAKTGKSMLGTKRAVWEDQAWLKEHAVDAADVRTVVQTSHIDQELTLVCFAPGPNHRTARGRSTITCSM